jgi:polysaccharide biosynthesis protein PslH
MRVLLSFLDSLVPPTYGGRIDVYERLLALRRLGVTVDLVFTIPEDADPNAAAEGLETLVTKVFPVKRNRSIWSALHWRPFNVVSRSALADVKFEDRYDAVFVESENVGEILRNPTLRYDKVFLRVHNDESKYIGDMGRKDSRISRKLLYFAERLRFRAYERWIDKRCDVLLFISKAEMDRMGPRRLAHGAKSAHFLPAGVSFDLLTLKRSPQPGVVLFVGSLFQPQNVQGLKWFIQHVHPKLLNRPHYEFLVVGNSQGADMPSIMRWLGAAGSVRVVADPPVLDEFYGSASIFVNPMQTGTGVKLKTVHAAAAGVPIVSTSVGAEGTGLVDGVHAMVRDAPDAFAEAIERLLDDSMLAARQASAARDLVAGSYDQGRVLKRLLQV